MLSKYNRLPLIFTILIPLTVAIGVHYLSSWFAVIPIFYIIAILLFTSFGKIHSSHYPFYIYTATLSLMFSASAVGAHIIGSDMQQEFYVSNQTLNGWHPTADYGTQSSTSFVVSWLIPQLHNLTSIPIAFIYKFILPIIFSFVPVALYFAFKKQTSPKIALISALFFMSVPVATLEIVQIGKAMVAELFFALTVLTLVSNIKQWKKCLTILICITIASLAHYTVGFIAISYLIAILIIRIITSRHQKWIFDKAKVSILSLLIIVIVSSGISYIYYSKADGGVIIDVVGSIVPGYTRTATDTMSSIVNPTGEGQIEDVNGTYNTRFGYLEEQPPLVKTAIGLDFFQVNTLGKIFRIIQYATQLMIIIGALYLLFNRKKYKFTTEFLAGIGTSFLLILACIFVPHFSSIINVTRFYHLALFFLAPVFVIGALFLIRNYKNITIILIAYLLFTSGFIFEAIQSKTIDKIEIPYSIGLSSERTGVVPNYSQSDIACAEWLRDNGKKIRIVGDYNGYRLMMAFIPISPQLRNVNDAYPPFINKLPKENCYVLVTSWNTKHKKIISDVRGTWEASGTRSELDLPEFDLPIVYQNGDSIIYEKY